jgi:hypothetical protein
MHLCKIIEIHDDNVNIWREWQRDPNRFVDAPSHGCSYEAWTKLKLLGLTHLARPGFIHKGQLNNLTRSVIVAFGNHTSLATQAWDRAASKANVYVAPLALRFNQRSMIEYFGSLPITDDPAELAPVIRAFAKQHNMHRYGPIVPETTDVNPSVADRIDLISCGLRGQSLENMAAAGFDGPRLERWLVQGNETYNPTAITRLEERAERYPNLSDGFISWWDTLYIEYLSTLDQGDYPVSDGFGKLKPFTSPHRNSQEWIAEQESSPYWEGFSESPRLQAAVEAEREALAAVVPEDWWHSTVTLEEDVDLEDAGGLSL